MANFITENITYMNTKYTLKNFRVFDEQGATFELAPVTVLTGCNSSGKSSIAKSLMLLKPLMSKYKKSLLNNEFYLFANEGVFSLYDLDFTRGRHNLGNFEKVINWNSTTKEFTISVEVYSVALYRSMNISFTFSNQSSKDAEQTLHAKLSKVEISTEGKIFYSYDESNEEIYVNLLAWKEDIIKIFNIANRVLQDSNENENLKVIKENYREKVDALTSFVDWQRKHVNLCKLSTVGEIDFPYGHIFSLGTLMDELNSIPKDDILHYAEDRFVNANSVKEAWYNNAVYKSWIHDMFEEFISSEYKKFSDFYSYYEGFKLSKSYTRFSNAISSRDKYIGTGTASLKESVWIGYCFPMANKNWAELSPIEKFYCIFYCLQGFGGYRTEYNKYTNIPEPLLIPQLESINQYALFACEEILMKCCNFIAEAESIELNRSNVQRIYSLDAQETSFSRILDIIYNIEDTIYPTSEQYDAYEKSTFATKWLKELTGFSGFCIKQAPEGVGYYVYLKKDKRLVSLADVGYGVTPLISMLLRIEIAICRSLEKNFLERITICVEEPESNLHPSVQAKLADLFADAAKHYPVNFILETHSEYLVRRSQVIVAEQHYEGEEMLKEKCPFKVYYMPRPDEGKPYDLEYKLDGKFRKKFGKGFFDIADSLALELL